ncbi:MAG: hypothetical protein HZA79_06415 [Sphingobacteriales bacterium]|nr:hypothetical protein [Sphingobacteriales bacterium]
MKKLLPACLLLCCVSTGSAQNDYKDQYLGWIKMVKPNDPVKPVQYDNRVFTAGQLSISNLFTNWIQASYTPKGGLGGVYKTSNEKLSPYNQNTKSLHPYYGASLPTYLFLKKKPGGGWTPENNLGLFLLVEANGLLGDYVDLISSPEQYYFYIPGKNGYEEYDKQQNTFLGFDKHPAFSKYIHFYQSGGIRYQAQYIVLLSRNNELPYIQITKGEFLEQLEKAIKKDFAARQEKINKDYGEESRKKYFRDYEKAAYDKRMNAYDKLKEKYKNRLQEKAAIYTEQPGIHLENQPDIFEGEAGNQRSFPVYKYDPVKIALTKSDRPQWIRINWGGSSMNDPVFKHMHASLLNNLDIDYIYNYFFDPEKVKGKPYQPLRPPVTEEKPDVQAVSGNTRKAQADPSVLLYEDFSNTATGKTPVSWISDLNSLGQGVQVETVSGQTGNWAVLKGNKITLRNKLQLPGNFLFSLEVAVPQNFTWGAKRLVIKLGTDKSSLLVNMKPGFDGNPGFLFTGPDQYGSDILTSSRAPEVPVPGFSNNKPFNKFLLQIRKNGRSLELLINQQQALLINDAFVVPDAGIRGIEISHSRSDSETEKYYISHIKIEKK